MIAYLSGKLLDKDLRSIVLDVNGVGYRVFVTTEIIQESEVGNDLEIWTYLAVRENSQDLYGFKEKTGLEMFNLLLTVSGIGPKSALAILNAASVEILTEGVQSGDAAYLSKLSGISKKNAEKIVINLKDKLGASSIETGGAKNQNAVAIDALVALGYSEREARDAIQNVAENNGSPEDIIKTALKNLGSQKIEICWKKR